MYDVFKATGKRASRQILSPECYEDFGDDDEQEDDIEYEEQEEESLETDEEVEWNDDNN